LTAALAAAAAAGAPARAQPSPADVAAYAAGCGKEAPAVAAVAGGLLAQEVLKAVSGRGAPAGNWLLFDTRQGLCAVQSLGLA